MNVSEAVNARNKIDLKATITNMGEVRSVNLKTGEVAKVAEATISDDSGEMLLNLWGDDINVYKVGDMIEIQNAYTTEFRGKVTLNKGKFGTLLKAS